MFNDPYAKFRDRSAALCTALGVASALALGGAMGAPTIADAAAAHPVPTQMSARAGSATVAPVVTDVAAAHPVAKAAAASPVNTQMPALAGTATPGSVITLTPGTFSNETTQDGIWERCPQVASTACTALVNSGTKYTLSLSYPPGTSVRLKETATNANGSTTVWSNAIGPMPGTGPVNTQMPSLAGSAVSGSAITLTPGTFANETSQDGTWEQCTTATSTACTATTNTGTKYALGANDPIADYIRLKEVATGANGTTTVWSNAVGPVTAPAPPPPPPGGYTGTCTKTISPGTNPATTEASMTAGQVLCLNSGKYQSITQSSANMFNTAGSTGNPITITSAPGQTATIQGADYINANNITFENLNLDIADTLGTDNGSDFAGCANPTSEGMEINGSYDTLQDDNIYESVNRANLIGIGWNASTANPVTGDIIHNDNIGPAGSCKQLDHLIYNDYSNGLQITQNWFFDDPYGYGVQFYQGPSNTTMTGNVLDNVLDGVIAASTGTGNLIQHNVAINLPNVSGYDSGMLANCYASGATTIQNNAIYNAANGFGTACGSLNITGTNPTLTANPFVGTKNSDNYTLASNTAATTIANYGLWNGQGAPTPNPATTYPQDPTNPGPS
jgi:hypothetical protein